MSLYDNMEIVSHPSWKRKKFARMFQNLEAQNESIDELHEVCWLETSIGEFWRRSKTAACLVGVSGSRGGFCDGLPS